ncbi:hypothetical protein PspLS_11661 [Pyricularia sp. CBS 133598]|nr:hypothetical protein PspLS_11661 [Pyricularia sp. CBS 133598]
MAKGLASHFNSGDHPRGSDAQRLRLELNIGLVKPKRKAAALGPKVNPQIIWTMEPAAEWPANRTTKSVYSWSDENIIFSIKAIKNGAMLLETMKNIYDAAMELRLRVCREEGKSGANSRGNFSPKSVN